MTKPLKGISILLTRPKEASKKWYSKLCDLGASVTIFPTFKLEKVEINIPPLEKYDLLIFTSANAVEYFFQSLQRDLQSLPPIACIGEKTAQKLSKYGHLPTYLSKGPTALDLGKELSLALQLSDMRILFPASAAALPELPKFLREKGAYLTHLPLYRPILNNADPSELLRKFEQNEIDTAIFASPSAARFFSILFEKKAGIPVQKYDIKWIAIGPTTAKEMKKLGFSPVYTSDRPNIDSIAELLITLFSKR